MAAMDDLDRAVLCSLSPNVSEAERKQAFQYTQRITEMPDGWKLCAQKLMVSRNPPVVHFCFMVFQQVVLHRYTSLSGEERMKLKSLLVQWMASTPQHPEFNRAIKSKFAATLVQVVNVEYPNEWPSFFRDIFDVMKAGSVDEQSKAVLVEMLLLILLELDATIVCRAAHRSVTDQAHAQRVKDAMRLDCIESIVDAWYSLLVTYAQNNQEITNLVLDNISRYIYWIDLKLIANDRFVPLIFQFLTAENLRVMAARCLYGMAEKGMPAEEKLQLLANLNLRNLVVNVTTDDVEFMEELAYLVDSIGSSAVVCVRHQDAAVCKQGVRILDEMLGLLFMYMANEYDDVSQKTFNFADAYLDLLREKDSLSPNELEHVKRLFLICSQKAQFLPDFVFGQNRDDEHEFDVYRRALKHTFQKLLRTHPKLVAELMIHTANDVLSNVASKPFHLVEAVLFLLNIFPEDASEIQKQWNEYPNVLQTIIMTVLKSNVSSYNHQMVTFQYLDLVVRFATYIPIDRAYVENVLSSLLDGRGIQNSNFAIVGRTLNQFNQLLGLWRSSQAAERAAVFHEFIPSCLDRLKTLLTWEFDGQAPNKRAPRLDVYERTRAANSVGLLIFQLQDPAVQLHFTQIMVTTVMNQIKQAFSMPIVNAQASALLALYLEDSLFVLGSLSKGFPHIPEHVIEPFKQSLDLVVHIIRQVPARRVRMRALFVMRTLVGGLGEKVFPFLPPVIESLMKDNHVQDMQAFLGFLHQISHQFKDALAPVLSQIFLSLCNHVFERLNTPATPGSEEERELVGLRVAFLNFLCNVVAHDLSSIYAIAEIRPHIPALLSFVANSLNTPAFPDVVRAAFNVLKEYITPFGKDAFFQQFLLKEMIPETFKLILSPHLDAEDGKTSLTLNVAATVHLSAVSLLQDRYVVIVADLLAQQGCAPAVAATHLEVLKTNSASRLRGFWLDLHKLMNQQRQRR